MPALLLVLDVGFKYLLINTLLMNRLSRLAVGCLFCVQ